ncbi:class I tRNA ligase family protein, partial [Clostridium perfringens]|uniref:class I tRNA ligase family protein n=1 Tax=Clostridium perfringens TaxID=1502 RepID=UPI002AC74704
MRAKEEGITPMDAVVKYHNEFKKCFDDLGFSLDIFAKTHSTYHENKVKEFILDLYKKGYIYEKEIDQKYCENCNEFLPKTYMEEKCPYCEEKLVTQTKHLFFSLSQFENDVRRLLIRQKGGRENAQKIVKRYLDEGLRDRAVTRDFNWGVDVPLE